MADNAAALRAGSLDAVQLFQPYAEEVIASGAAHVWYAAADRGLTAYTTLVTRRPLLQSRRDEFLRMTRAMAITLRWIAMTPGADIAHALSGFFPAVAPDIFARAIDRYHTLKLFAPDPVLRREGFDRLQAAMRSGGALDRAIPFDRCVDTALAEEALADISERR
jgi:NitT/TauT family transport system substrate-binding protein